MKKTIFLIALFSLMVLVGCDNGVSKKYKKLKVCQRCWDELTSEIKS